MHLPKSLSVYRLTPPYAVMILLEATILAYIGDGPMWHEKIDHGATQCREHWWPGLLYLQNFIHPTSPVRKEKQNENNA